MARLVIVNPVAEPKAESALAVRFDAAQRSASLEGKVVGLYWNGKAGGEVALARTREQLQRIFPTAQFREYLGEHGTFMRQATKQQLDLIAGECQAVVGTTAD